MLGNDHLVFSTIQVAPGRQWNHPVAGWRFLLIKQGLGSLHSNSTSYPLAQGDALVLTTPNGGYFQAHPKAELALCLFRFHPDQLIGLLTLAEWRRLESIATRPQGVRVFAADTPFAKQYRNLAGQTALTGGFAQRCVVLQLVATILEQEKPSTPAPSATQVSAGDRVSDFLTNLSEAQLQELSVSELARKCGYSRRHLNRLFHKNFGRSILRMKMQLRLERAASLLRASDSKVIDIALKCGFSHLGLFSAKFKERFGASPGEWRRLEEAKRHQAEALASAHTAATSTTARPLVALPPLHRTPRPRSTASA